MLINIKNENDCSIKSIIVEFLKKNGIPYSAIETDINGKICIKLECEYEVSKNKQYYTPFIITTSNKDVCKVYPYEIMYIAIDGRESVIHLIDNTTVITNHHISYFEDILPDNCFARPHNSYIVNLNYVTKVTREFVHLKYKETQHSIYTSQRKVSAFKKAFLNFEK